MRLMIVDHIQALLKASKRRMVGTETGPQVKSIDRFKLISNVHGL